MHYVNLAGCPAGGVCLGMNIYSVWNSWTCENKVRNKQGELEKVGLMAPFWPFVMVIMFSQMGNFSPICLNNKPIYSAFLHCYFYLHFYPSDLSLVFS